MKNHYFYTILHDKYVRVDLDNNTSYAIFNGVEKEMSSHTKTVTDAIIQGEITKEEYEKHLTNIKNND